MTNADLNTIIQAELDAAQAAHAAGNEGRARVHARRAAGKAAEIYRTVYFPGGLRLNGFRHLQRVAADKKLPPDLRAAAERLTVHVTPDHTLPHDEDPLEDARTLAAALLARLPAED